MKIPSYIFPKYYSIQLSKNQKKKIPEVGLFDSPELTKRLKNIKKKVNDFNIESKNNYLKEMKELSKEEIKRKSVRIFDFTGNINFDRKIQNKINEKGNFTNAWRKMFELCKSEEIIPNVKKVKHFDICCMPGAFILAINHYIKTEMQETGYDWYGQSFTATGKKKYFGDALGLFQKNPEKLILGVSGDITNPDNLNYYRYFFRNKKRNLITSDCGLGGTESHDYTRENQMLRIFFCQFLSGISVLEKGGNFLMKFYDFYSVFNISFVYLMGLFFKEVKLIKPESSRQPRGHEIYLFCRCFKDNLTPELYQELVDLSTKLNLSRDLDKSILQEKDIDLDIFEHIQDGISDYYEDMMKRNLEERKYTDKIIGVNVFKETELFLERREDLIKIFKPDVIKYLRNYVDRMDYKRIENKDKLV